MYFENLAFNATYIMNRNHRTSIKAKVRSSKNKAGQNACVTLLGNNKQVAASNRKMEGCSCC